MGRQAECSSLPVGLRPAVHAWEEPTACPAGWRGGASGFAPPSVATSSSLTPMQVEGSGFSAQGDLPVASGGSLVVPERTAEAVAWCLLGPQAGSHRCSRSRDLDCGPLLEGVSANLTEFPMGAEGFERNAGWGTTLAPAPKASHSAGWADPGGVFSMVPLHSVSSQSGGPFPLKCEKGRGVNSAVVAAILTFLTP